MIGRLDSRSGPSTRSNRFQDSRLPSVVVSNQDNILSEVEGSFTDAAEYRSFSSFRCYSLFRSCM
jgi:hypothetical protein